MVNVTINMSMKDFECIKEELIKAKQNTELSPVADVKKYIRDNMNMANAQIAHIMNILGI